ncbi:LytR C-terminal domain-containing protein [Paenarthrobacter aurescens]|uniref:LytR C-terminal domain-containing protein n=1 Tax=Paenarthrobacter aurescens TaxID=43663 RepID=UPI0011445603|nr:LytR C-terminal domain-containing protein [Paenarthrobacter aurescens]MDO6142296.1 LytR C-terminal domain-containing protein [Paenarthrobacter aurescens]MDO6146143.1 LytR C-terminal domain-containing protein [Paenarthrobacter aurescens]MDO6157388.1 LytR C-terminal domain-containing protein [Paenarthrobacter aurescens]MDO6161373.1 LytR C-terminal domain-containing protein [Paenarthrobacter aurescens]
MTQLHGHHVVTGPELRATFAEDELVNKTRFRRRLLHGIVLVLLVGLIAAGAVGAWAIMNGVVKVPTAIASKAPTSLCPATTFDYVPNETVTLNVFNATSRAGLAGTVADQFKARGFKVASVDNSDTAYSGVGVVVSGVKGQAAAFNIQRNIAGTDYFEDNREDESVDVILTPDFEGLVEPQLVDQTPGMLECPREDLRIADNAKWPIIPTRPPGQ